MAKSRFRKAKGYKDSIRKRTESQSGGGGFINIFKDSSNLPLFREKEGDYGIDIIPYLTSDKHPYLPEDTPDYILEIWVHKSVGPEKADYVCLRNYGRDCPLCEARWAELASDNPREKIADDLKASHRGIYNVLVVFPAQEEAKGIQVWESSTYLAENEFRDNAKNRKTGEKIPFADPDDGKTLYFEVKGKGLNKKFTAIVLEDRDPIEDDYLDEAFILEDHIIIPDPEDLEKVAKVVLGSGSAHDDEEPDPPRRRRKSNDDEDDEPPRRRSRDDEDDRPSRRSSKKDDREEDEPDDRDDDKDDAPIRGRGRSRDRDEDDERPSRSRRRDRDEDDREEPEEEEERPRSRRRRSSEEDEEEEKSTSSRRRRRLKD